jgi:transcriptional regulator with XRE-family HTH domain
LPITSAKAPRAGPLVTREIRVNCSRAAYVRIWATPLGLTASNDDYILANMLGDERRKFGSFLRKWRARNNLTLRGLAEASKVPFPNISAVECGRLGAGSIVARKLARGLGLRGPQKEQFLACAAYTNSRDRLSKEHLAYPGTLANLLPRLLREQGVKVAGCARPSHRGRNGVCFGIDLS